jgi:hypothetical protein
MVGIGRGEFAMTLASRVETALRSLKDTFLLQPEGRLHEVEVAGLCRLDDDLCRALLMALHDVRFLARDAEGQYHLARRDVLD